MPCWQAARKPRHSLERLLLVTAFAIAPYSAAKRARKPIYPVLGETFEAVMPEKRVRFIAEQVLCNQDSLSSCDLQSSCKLLLNYIFNAVLCSLLPNASGVIIPPLSIIIVSTMLV